MKRAALSILIFLACSAPPTPVHPHASEVEHPIRETDLPVVRLTPEAVKRLGIETATVEQGPLPRSRLVGGEVVGGADLAVVLVRPCGRHVLHDEEEGRRVGTE